MLYVHGGFIRITAAQPHCVSPLQVAVQKDKDKKRLILDLSKVNKFIKTQSFKMDTLQAFLPCVPPDSFGVTYDLKGGYHHVPIHPDFYKFLGFSFSIGGHSFFAYFIVCPFGLAPVPQLFTKVLKPIVSHWRAQGFIHALYLDDGFNVSQSENQCKKESQIIQADLERLGLFTQPKKCQFSPSQNCSWLGFDIDLASSKISVPPKKLQKLFALVAKLSGSQSISCRQLLKLVGSMCCLYLVFGCSVYLLTKPIHVLCDQMLENNTPYDALFPLSEYLRYLILNCRQVLSRLPATRVFAWSAPDYFVFSDASDYGGASVVHKLNHMLSDECAISAFGIQTLREIRYGKSNPSDPGAPTPVFHSVLENLGTRESSKAWPEDNDLAVINWGSDIKRESSTYRELFTLWHGLVSLETL